MEYHFNLHLIGVAYCIWAENVIFTVKGHTVLQMKEGKKNTFRVYEIIRNALVEIAINNMKCSIQ